MKVQEHIPTSLIAAKGQVHILEAAPGKARTDAIATWLQAAEVRGARTWLLTTDRDRDGVWAGLQELLTDLLPQLQSQAPDLITQHDYELARILPDLRRTINVRYSTLTDRADEYEQIRNYPADRAFRIVQGIIDLLIAWFERSASSQWVIVLDSYDRSGALIRLFVRELVRRTENCLNLTVLIAISPTAHPDVVDKFDPHYLGEYIHLNLAPDSYLDRESALPSNLSTELAETIDRHPIDAEIDLPRLIYALLSSESPELAFEYEVKLASLYSRKGYYEDALAIAHSALKHQEIYHPTQTEKRWHLQAILYMCYVTLDKPLQALAIVETAMQETDRANLLFRNCFMMAMLYVRELPDRDLVTGERYLERGLAALETANLPNDEKIFHQTANRNGLALIRSRQGKHQEAINLCQWCLAQIDAVYSPEKHRLYRSVLLFNIAQVHNFIGNFDRAIDYLSLAIELDPNYSEYWNLRGNWYFNAGDISQALTNYLRAIELSPPYSEVWANVGQCYRRLGKNHEAVIAYSRALDLQSQQFPILVARAQAFESLAEFDAALTDYHTALQIEPDRPLVLANRAILYYEMGQLHQAIADFDQAIAIAPDNTDILENRAIAASGLKDV